MSIDVDKTRREFALWVIRWARRVRLLRSASERLERLTLHSLYECVGGPLDGKSVALDPGFMTLYRGRGFYDVGPDNRLHYHELAASWFKKESS